MFTSILMTVLTLFYFIGFMARTDLTKRVPLFHMTNARFSAFGWVQVLSYSWNQRSGVANSRTLPAGSSK